MNKFLLYFYLILVISFSANAQFTVTKLDGTPIQNGDIFEFTNYNQNISSTVADLKFIVTNTSAQNLKMRIRCNNLINTTGANFQLCFGSVCFEGVTSGTAYPDYDYIIPSGGSNSGSGDAFKNFNPGDGTNYPCDYVFRFFALDQNGDPVGSNINITYRYQGPLSLEQQDKLSNMGVKVLNIQVDNFVGLEITKQVDVNLINIQGQTILSNQLNSNTNLDLSSLQTGIYFLNFYNNEGVSDSVKIYKK